MNRNGISLGTTVLLAGAAMAVQAVELKTSCKDPKGWEFETEKVVEDGCEVFTVKLTNAQPTRPPEFDAWFTTSGADAHNIWVPESEPNERTRLFAQEWGPVRYKSELGRSSPIACAFNEASENKLTVAASEALRHVRYGISVLSTTADLEGHFRFFIREEAPRTDYTVKIRVDTRPQFFGEAVTGATRWIEKESGLKPCRVPEAAFDPLYSSWYAFWQDVHDKDLEVEAKMAAELGMKTMILDDGWQKSESKSYYSATGDWLPVADRFPDFKGHVDKVHAAGLKYMLWLSVPFVGNESKAYERFKDKFLGGGSVGVLDPRFPEVRQYLIDTYVRCVKEYGFDGLKLDFIDAIATDNDPAVKDNWKGRDIKTVPDAVDRLMKDVYATLSAINPDILIEFRQQYIGPAMRQYGNMFRATDCPSDLVGNRVRIADLRLTSGSTAVHSDMLVWSAQDKPEDAARVILNAIFGAVQYSMKLATIPPEQKDVIRHWLRFSQEHRATLLKGDFRPFNPELQYPIIEAESAVEKIVAVYADNLVVTAAADKPTYILNASHGEELVVRTSGSAEVQTVDCRGRAVAKTSGDGLFVVRVPQGGYATITVDAESSPRQSKDSNRSIERGEDTASTSL